MEKQPFNISISDQGQIFLYCKHLVPNVSRADEPIGKTRICRECPPDAGKMMGRLLLVMGGD